MCIPICTFKDIHRYLGLKHVEVKLTSFVSSYSSYIYIFLDRFKVVLFLNIYGLKNILVCVFVKKNHGISGPDGIVVAKKKCVVIELHWPVIQSSRIYGLPTLNPWSLSD